MTEKTKRKTPPQTFRQKYGFLMFTIGCVIAPYPVMFIILLFNSAVHLPLFLSALSNILIIFAVLTLVWLFIYNFSRSGSDVLQRKNIFTSLASLVMSLLMIPGLFLFIMGAVLSVELAPEFDSRVVVDETVYYVMDMPEFMDSSAVWVIYECTPTELFCFRVSDEILKFYRYSLSPQQAEDLVISELAAQAGNEGDNLND